MVAIGTLGPHRRREERSVLYGLVLRAHPGTLNESLTRRAQWQVPEGVNIVAEYWFPTNDPSVVSIVEADDQSALLPISMAWDDVFDIDIFPVTPAEEGLERLRRMGPSSAQG
jgi:hypothetical protein